LEVPETRKHGAQGQSERLKKKTWILKRASTKACIIQAVKDTSLLGEDRYQKLDL